MMTSFECFKQMLNTCSVGVNYVILIALSIVVLAFHSVHQPSLRLLLDCLWLEIAMYLFCMQVCTLFNKLTIF